MSKRGSNKRNQPDEPEAGPSRGSLKRNRRDGSESDGRGSGSAPSGNPALTAGSPPPPPPNMPVPPPLPIGLNGFQKGTPEILEELHPTRTFEYQFGEALYNRGVWDEDRRSYEFKIPKWSRKAKFDGDDQFPEQIAVTVTDEPPNEEVFIPEGAEHQPYRRFNYMPEKTSAYLIDNQKQRHKVDLEPEWHTYYPPRRPIFPETTGIFSTNQPRLQPVEDYLRYAADGKPDIGKLASNRVSLLGQPAQPRLRLQGTPMNEVVTNPNIPGKRWDPQNQYMHTQGLDHRVSSLKKKKKPMDRVRTMPKIGEDEVAATPNPNAFPQPTFWSRKSRRVVETHPHTFDRASPRHRRLRGIRRTGTGVPPTGPFQYVDTRAEWAAMHQPPQLPPEPNQPNQPPPGEVPEAEPEEDMEEDQGYGPEEEEDTEAEDE